MLGRYIKGLSLALGITTLLYSLSPAQSAGENQVNPRELLKLLSLPTAQASPSPSPTPSHSLHPNEVVKFEREEGKPMRVTYADGRILQVEMNGGLMWFWTYANMSENSCTKKTGVKCKIIIPIEFRQFIARWVKHPTREGQVVVSKRSERAEENDVEGSSTFVSPLQRNEFKRLRDRLAQTPSRNEMEEKFFAIPENTLGWLECGQSVFDGQLTDVQYWDENFELQNNEMGFFNSDNPAVNQFSSRLQSVKISEKDGNVYFSVPKRTFGIFSKFLPPGVSYQIQWTVNMPNLIEVGRPTCDVKWDLNFGRIFTQFTALSVTGRPLKDVKVDGFKPYLFDAYDASNISINYFLSRDKWRQELM